MRNKSYLMIAGLLALTALFAVMGCRQATSTRTPSEQTSTVSGEPTVVANDQSITASRVVIQSVVTTSPGWVAIHVDRDGQPGAVIGHAAISAGDNQNVTVAIDQTLATPILWAVLHSDDTDVGVWDFPEGDFAVMIDGRLVARAFSSGLAPPAETSPTPEGGGSETGTGTGTGAPGTGTGGETSPTPPPGSTIPPPTPGGATATP